MTDDPRNAPGGSCEQIRELLDGYLSRELTAEQTREVERHLADCAGCTAEFEAGRRLRAQLQETVRGEPVPAGLESRIRKALAGAPARRRSGWWAVAAAAAVIAIVAMVSYLRQQGNPEESILRKTTGRLAALLNVGLRDHLECAVLRKYPKQAIPTQEMTAELGPDWAELLPLVEAKLPGDLHVIQAHRCQAAGRQFTHFIIAGAGKDQGKIVSLLLTERRPGESISGIDQTGVDRFQVVAFESADYLVYVISDMDAQENLALAARLAPTLREFLSRHGWAG